MSKNCLAKKTVESGRGRCDGGSARNQYGEGPRPGVPQHLRQDADLADHR